MNEEFLHNILFTLMCLYPHIPVSAATLEGYATGTHVSKGKGKTPKGGLTIACKDRCGELGRLNSAYTRLESKESFDANVAGYKHHGRVPRDDISSYNKSRDEFSKEEEEEIRLANWIRRRKKSLKAMQKQLEAYVEEHPNENDGVSKMLDDVRERVATVTKTWEAKRKRN
jgi:hypothetical protein